MTQITLLGNPVQTNGDIPKAGDNAPAFTLTRNNLKDVSLQNLSAKTDTGTLLISSVPSIDTEVCAISTNTLEKLALKWSQVQFLLVSMDLPFAQQRFCAANSIKHVKCLSCMRDKNFAKDYGLLIQDGVMAGLLARAVVIIQDGKITYSQLVEEITQQPDFKAIQTALNNL